VTGLVGVFGKLWTDKCRELTEARADLAAANQRIVELQRDDQVRAGQLVTEHVRDLRRMAGLSTSLGPPSQSPWPPPVVRAKRTVK
jgi:hypothetical protein